MSTNGKVIRNAVPITEAREALKAFGDVVDRLYSEANQAFVAKQAAVEAKDKDAVTAADVRIASAQAMIGAWQTAFKAFDAILISIRQKHDGLWKAQAFRAEVLGEVKPIRKPKDVSEATAKVDPLASFEAFMTGGTK